MLRQRDEGALLGYLFSQRKYLPNVEFRMFPMDLTMRRQAGGQAGTYLPPTLPYIFLLPYQLNTTWMDCRTDLRCLSPVSLGEVAADTVPYRREVLVPACSSISLLLLPRRSKRHGWQ
jgi:hypothetical protein